MSQHDASLDDGRGPLTGRMVLAATVAAFLVIIGVNAIMSYYAVTTFRGLADPSPYEHGLAYEKDILAAKAQDALGWDVSAHVARGDDGKKAVEVRFMGPDGAPVSGLAVSASLVSPADARLDAALTLKEIQPGVYLGLVEAAPGQRDLMLEAVRGGERVFRSKNRIELQ